MKSLVVYYTLDGHTRLLAEIIAQETGADIFELKPVKSTGKSGFAKYFLGGMRASLNMKTKLLTPLPDLKEYDLIFIGTPIWASRFTPAVNTFISGSDLTSKKLLFFASSGGGNAGKCFEMLKSRLGRSQILGQIGFAESKAESQAGIESQIKAWLAGINFHS